MKDTNISLTIAHSVFASHSCHQGGGAASQYLIDIQPLIIIVFNGHSLVLFVNIFWLQEIVYHVEVGPGIMIKGIDVPMGSG